MIQAPISRQEAHEVPLDQIEYELARLWRDSDAKILSAGGQIPLRNRVMTLTAYAEGDDQALYAAKVIDSLTGQHPSRSIIVTLLPHEQGEPVTASIALNSYRSHGTLPPMRAEQIALVVRGNAVHYVSSFVLPLLLPEMPAFVWWTGHLPNSELCRPLIEASDRTLVDSCDFADPESDFIHLAEIIREQIEHHGNRTAFSDFTWMRINSWRETTSHFFDRALHQKYLQGIERVEIEYAKDDQHYNNPLQAYLFAGWLASRLKWQSYTRIKTAPGAVRIGLHTQAGSPITLEITPRIGISTRDWWASSSAEWNLNDVNGPSVANTYVSPGALMRVSIQTRIEDKAASFTILRDESMKFATTVVVLAGETTTQTHIPLDSNGEGSLLSQQLSLFAHNPVFEEAVLAARFMMTVVRK